MHLHFWHLFPFTNTHAHTQFTLRSIGKRMNAKTDWANNNYCLVRKQSAIGQLTMIWRVTNSHFGKQPEW